MDKQGLQQAIAHDNEQINRIRSWMTQVQDEQILSAHLAAIRLLEELKEDAEKELAELEKTN